MARHGDTSSRSLSPRHATRTIFGPHKSRGRGVLTTYPGMVDGNNQGVSHDARRVASDQDPGCWWIRDPASRISDTKGAEMMMTTHEADGVFQEGGVKGLALV